MGWNIECLNKNKCDGAYADNIVDLMQDGHLDNQNRFVCRCGNAGYIEKKFKVGKSWWIRGAIIFPDMDDEEYQPFVFLVNHDNRNDPPHSLWFSYYNDRRPVRKLSMKYGPVLGIKDVTWLLESLSSKLLAISFCD